MILELHEMIYQFKWSINLKSSQFNNPGIQIMAYFT